MFLRCNFLCCNSDPLVRRIRKYSVSVCDKEERCSLCGHLGIIGGNECEILDCGQEDTGIKGNVVKVVSDGNYNPLSLCEVEVYGKNLQ